MIEVELKIEKPLEHKAVCFCGQPATRIVVIGQIQNHYGTDYAICNDEQCLNEAMDNEIDDIYYTRRHRTQLMAEGF